MLVLTRRAGEKVHLFCKHTGRLLATVEVTEVRGDKIRLGFTADYDDIQISREEIAPVHANA